MDRKFYLDLAARGLCMPIGADLVLNEEAEPEKARNDGAALGRAIEREARRWNTPLAVPLMDLRMEKIDLLALIGISAEEAQSACCYGLRCKPRSVTMKSMGTSWGCGYTVSRRANSKPTPMVTGRLGAACSV